MDIMVTYWLQVHEACREIKLLWLQSLATLQTHKI